ncbi:glycerol kinase GlpK [Christensenellaceae bacterium OttesenSCG-928-L17]|nr:glycerol kinase GlpK [Christensenellaceae bacterium OttesenSCG-928-L17]
METILAIDQGTTGTRAILYDLQFNTIAQSYLAHVQHTPHPGWCEHDAMELYHNTLEVIDKALQLGTAKHPNLKVLCAGIANQGETVAAWSKKTGEPLCRAIVWHCQRTADIVDALKKDVSLCEYIHQTTGLMANSYFSAPKYRWLLENIPAVATASREGDLCLGTLDSWLIYKLTGGQQFVTDCATASRTMLCNIHTLDWDETLLDAFGLRREYLARILPNTAHYGEIALPHLPVIPLTASIVDQQGALFGQKCFTPGTLKATYGTGCFVLMNTGDRAYFTDNGLLTTLAWNVGGNIQYALDGGIHFAGSTLQWLRDNLCIIDDYNDMDALAASLDESGGVYFVPAFSGLSVPYWDQTARGMIIGLTMNSTRAHIVRAALEAIAYQMWDLLTLMEETTDMHIHEVRVDGGVTRSHFLMQTQSDILQRSVRVNKHYEATARGVAMLAGLGANIYTGPEAFGLLHENTQSFSPIQSPEVVAQKLNGWKTAVSRCMHWTDR